MNNQQFRNPLKKGELRNKPCICGSELKLKHCHGEKDFLQMDEYVEVKKLISDFSTVTKRLIAQAQSLS